MWSLPSLGTHFLIDDKSRHHVLLARSTRLVVGLHERADMKERVMGVGTRSTHHLVSSLVGLASRHASLLLLLLLLW